MKKLIVFAVMAISQIAAADGFVCSTNEDSLVVKVYNHIRAEDGTRNASVMVLSDSNVSQGRKTIARFTDVNGTLSSEGASYEANVDLRFSDSSRKGELIAGTKLGELDTVTLNVMYSYNTPVENGAVVPAYVNLLKRNGTRISLKALCARYLKN